MKMNPVTQKNQIGNQKQARKRGSHAKKLPLTKQNDDETVEDSVLSNFGETGDEDENETLDESFVDEQQSNEVDILKNVTCSAYNINEDSQPPSPQVSSSVSYNKKSKKRLSIDVLKENAENIPLESKTENTKAVSTEKNATFDYL